MLHNIYPRHDDLGIKFVKRIILNDAKTYYQRLDEHSNKNAIDSFFL